jgi:hypothetical protein
MNNPHHMTRMEKITERINEYNERRWRWILTGASATHPERFAQWEADELEKRKRFEEETLKETAENL